MIDRGASRGFTSPRICADLGDFDLDVGNGPILHSPYLYAEFLTLPIAAAALQPWNSATLRAACAVRGSSPLASRAR